ncbi:triose-phosphate isomerase [Candidatus Gracilibacteria bacterium]|nr:triose-phosphate isomerase [Candidatus Gracilibacteria bacterium]
MELPVIIVNFKVYESAVGERAVELAKIHEKVAKETGASIAIAVNALDLAAVIAAVDIPVFAQHIDDVGFGSNTGHVLPTLVKKMGAFGTILNHAERQIPKDQIRDHVKAAKDAGLFTIVCANDPECAREIFQYYPDLIAVEPPELIGGDISVSKAGPEIIEEAVKICGKGKTLVGAGIRDPEDVTIALKLGSVGVLLASGVTKADDPESVLRGLVGGLSQT